MADHRRKYAAPPLVEALCEVHFEPGREWDWTIPGLLYGEVKDEFPVREPADQAIVAQQPPKGQKNASPRLRFFTEDKAALVQVGENFVVLNCLNPYPGWERFHALLSHVLEKYLLVASPKGVARCALRYINRIEVPKEGAVLDDYLQAVPQVPKNLPQTLSGWALSLDIPHPSGEGIVHLESGSIGSGESAFILDLQFIALNPSGLGLDGALLRWIDNAHQIIEDTFEVSITDTARAYFQEEHSHDQLSAR